MNAGRKDIPFCVDLDGTLIHADLSVESLVKALWRHPWVVFYLPFWFFASKQRLKTELARLGPLSVDTLPYNGAVVDLVIEARAAGRRTVLVTGSHHAISEPVAAWLELFDEFLATDAETNLTGRRKAERLVELFGEGGFEYVGNGSVDLPVWESSGAVVTVNVPKKVLAKVQNLGKPHRDLGRVTASPRTWFRQFRIHQWTKNALLFLPLITAHKVLQFDLVFAAILGFISFGLLASATYVINDIVDLDADRANPGKRDRPLASGKISVVAAALAALGLAAASFGIAWFLLPVSFMLALLTYLLLTLLYSFWLKRIPSVDVVTLASLYTLRIIAGAFLVGVELSFWLLAFSMFLFLSLAMVKRVTELTEYGSRENDMEQGLRALSGRGYDPRDTVVLQALGCASGYMAVMVFALYINSVEVRLLYQTPEILWLMAPILLLWVTRMWLKTARGEMHGDPVVFAIMDKETWVAAAASAGIIICATVLDLAMLTS